MWGLAPSVPGAIVYSNSPKRPLVSFPVTLNVQRVPLPMLTDHPLPGSRMRGHGHSAWTRVWGSRRPGGSAGRVAAVREDRLPGDPPPLGRKEPDDGHDVVNVRQLPVHAGGLVVGDRIRRLGGIEERGVHGTGCDVVDGDAPRTELLRRRPREVLHRRLAAG